MTDGDANELTHSSKPTGDTNKSHDTQSIKQLPSIEYSGNGQSHETINHEGRATSNIHNSAPTNRPPAIIMAGDGPSRASSSP